MASVDPILKREFHKAVVDGRLGEEPTGVRLKAFCDGQEVTMEEGREILKILKNEKSFNGPARSRASGSYMSGTLIGTASSSMVKQSPRSEKPTRKSIEASTAAPKTTSKALPAQDTIHLGPQNTGRMIVLFRTAAKLLPAELQASLETNLQTRSLLETLRAVSSDIMRERSGRTLDQWFGRVIDNAVAEAPRVKQKLATRRGKDTRAHNKTCKGAKCDDAACKKRQGKKQGAMTRAEKRAEELRIEAEAFLKRP